MEILLNLGQNQSLADKLNYVAKINNAYIIDNHLAAIWIMCKLDCRKRYNLLHIDRHYDLKKADPILHSDIQNINIKKISIKKLDTKTKVFEKMKYNLFLWNNYINVFNQKHPNTISKVYFLTKDIDEFNYEKEYCKIKYSNLKKLDLGKGNWIINIDLDYFFNEENEQNIRSHTNNEIRLFARWLNQIKEKAAVIIICLSPECCSNNQSWRESIEVLNIINAELEYPQMT